MRALVAAVSFAGLGAGCLSVPNGAQPACSSNSDCNTAAGEVCEEGLCWGDPPPGMFAATLGPPSARTDVVSTELASLQIPANGWLGPDPTSSFLALDTPVTISGRVEATCPMGQTCDGASLGATITVTRKSRFPGGPGFRAVVISKSGVVRGSDSFAVAVPPTAADDPPYVVTIVPCNNADCTGANDLPPTTTSSPAGVAPPMRTTLTAAQNVSRVFTLGSLTPTILTGNLTDSTGHPLAKYRVVAVGRWDATAPPSEVSTIAYAPSGQFSIELADGIVGPVELVAKPYDPNVVAPTLRLPGVAAVSYARTITQPAYLGNPIVVTIPVRGVGGDGAVAPVSGARVIISGHYDPPALTEGVSADLVVETATGDDGLAHLTLLDGLTLAPSYKLDVIPPASSNLGVIYAQPFAFDQPADVRLPARIALRGRVVDSAGHPIGNVSVTAQPSQRFKWSLDAAQQLFAGNIPAATTITSDTGGFDVWVDPLIDGVWGYYDLGFEPATPEPSWTQADVEIPRVLAQTASPLGDIAIPPAAFLHGRITDPGGASVAGGELRIYTLSANSALCSQVAHAPEPCVIPAQLLGHGTSDDQGIVRLSLPRP